MLDSGFGDFFRQLPAIFIIMFCGSSLALVAVLAVIINNRGKRARTAEASAAPITVHSATVAPSGGSGGDLPDLDSLLNVDPSSPAPRPIQRGTIMLTTTPGESIEAVEVMTILRDVAEGGLIIQIGDKVFRNPPALADAEFKRRFNSTVRDLYQSIGATSLGTKATGEMTAAVEEEEVREVPPVVPPPPIAPGEPAPGDLPKFKVPDFQEKPKRRKGPAEQIPEINIAGAIEEYLQYKLSMTTQFARRFIHVRPSVGGGLRIDVDDKSYETVGDIEDESVRLFLQATIEEWQSRQ